MARKISTSQTVTIASGATDSGAIDLNGYTLCGMFIPSAITGTTITFKADDGTGTYVVMENGAGANISATVSASKYIALSPTDFAGVGKLKLVSSASEGADRDIILALRVID